MGGRRGRHGRHYYLGDKIMDLKQLQKELKKSNPLMNLPEKERLWLIDYAKLRACYFKYHDLFDEIEFPSLDTAYLEDKSQQPAWKTSHRPNIHPINHTLGEVKAVLNRVGVDWERESDYKVNYIVCDRHHLEGCEGCKFIRDCDLIKI